MQLVDVVAVETIGRPKIPFPLAIWFLIFAWLNIKCPVTCKVDASNVSEHFNNLCALEYLKTPKLTVRPQSLFLDFLVGYHIRLYINFACVFHVHLYMILW